jgi:hypothetical protein
LINFVARADAARHLWEAIQEGDRADFVSQSHADATKQIGAT